MPHSVLQKVIDLLLPHNGPMQFSELTQAFRYNSDYFDWDDFFTASSQYRQTHQLSEKDVLIILTELHNKENWFSSFDLKNTRTIFIHAVEWENFIYCDSIYPIAYEIVQNVFDCIAYQQLQVKFWTYIHKEPIGCINDLCSWKPDITFKLRTADICVKCSELINETVGSKFLAQGIEIIESVRRKMVFTANYQKAQSFEERLLSQWLLQSVNSELLWSHFGNYLC